MCEGNLMYINNAIDPRDRSTRKSIRALAHRRRLRIGNLRRKLYSQWGFILWKDKNGDIGEKNQISSAPESLMEWRLVRASNYTSREIVMMCCVPSHLCGAWRAPNALGRGSGLDRWYWSGWGWWTASQWVNVQQKRPWESSLTAFPWTWEHSNCRLASLQCDPQVSCSSRRRFGQGRSRNWFLRSYVQGIGQKFICDGFNRSYRDLAMEENWLGALCDASQSHPPLLTSSPFGRCSSAIAGSNADPEQPFVWMQKCVLNRDNHSPGPA